MAQKLVKVATKDTVDYWDEACEALIAQDRLSLIHI